MPLLILSLSQVFAVGCMGVDRVSCMTRLCSLLPRPHRPSHLSQHSGIVLYWRNPGLSRMGRMTLIAQDLTCLRYTSTHLFSLQRALHMCGAHAAEGGVALLRNCELRCYDLVAVPHSASSRSFFRRFLGAAVLKTEAGRDSVDMGTRAAKRSSSAAAERRL